MKNLLMRHAPDCRRSWTDWRPVRHPPH